MTAETSSETLVGRILLFDDLPETLKCFQRHLERGGYAVELLSDVEAAFSAALSGRFDVAFVDLMVGDDPVGLSLVGSMKSDPRTAHLPIVAMTGYGREHILEALKAGADAGRQKTELFEEALTLIQRLRSQRLACVPVALHLSDDGGWGEMVRAALEPEGLILRRASSPRALYRLVEEEGVRPDVVVVDLDQSGEDALETLKDLKAHPILGRPPKVAHTAQPDLKLPALRNGVVNVVIKGPSQLELVATVKSVLDQHECSRGVIERGDLKLDPRGCLVLLCGKLLAPLEPHLFSMLRTLVEASPREVSDAVLWGAVAQRHGGDDESHSRSLETYMTHLRKPLRPIVSERIRRVKGVGYRYSA